MNLAKQPCPVLSAQQSMSNDDDSGRLAERVRVRNWLQTLKEGHGCQARRQRHGWRVEGFTALCREEQDLFLVVSRRGIISASLRMSAARSP